MSCELKFFLIRLIVLIVLTPLAGFVFLHYTEYVEKTWKMNNRRKKWFILCQIFFLLACLGGWLL